MAKKWDDCRLARQREKYIGLRSGKLTCIEYLHSSVGIRNYPMVICSCECGGVIETRACSIRDKQTKSCGCISNATHGLSKTRQYSIWTGMKARCVNTSNQDYMLYGGRGIKYQESWEDFLCFWEDMKDGYSDDLEIDRIDNNGNYCKENCRWATRQQQVINRNVSVRVNYLGEDMYLSDLAEITGLSENVLSDRIYAGWGMDKIVGEPKRPKRVFVKINGEMLPPNKIFKSSPNLYPLAKKNGLFVCEMLALFFDEVYREDNYSLARVEKPDGFYNIVLPNFSESYIENYGGNL